MAEARTAPRRLSESIGPRFEMLRELYLGMRTERDLLTGLVNEYADHQSWRCAHPDRYPWNPDCPCGLVGKLAAAGMEPGQARSPSVAVTLTGTTGSVDDVLDRIDEAISGPR